MVPRNGIMLLVNSFCTLEYLGRFTAGDPPGVLNPITPKWLLLGLGLRKASLISIGIKTDRVSSMKKKQKGDHNPCILQLPNHILEEIFNKIRIKTIIRCMFVFKLLHRLISDPRFTEQHFPRTTCLLLRGSSYNTEGEGHFLANIDNASPSPNDVVLKLSQYPIVLLVVNIVNIVGSCNGFLRLHKCDYMNNKYDSFYISNPITGESLALPTPPAMALNMTNFTCGFGLSPMSGTYKIDWLRGRYGLEPEALVLTVGSGAWRSTGKCRYHFMYKHGICLSGFLHWINHSRTMICAFDLESEDFHKLPLPPHWDLESLKKSGLDFRVLRGCLSVTVRSMERMSIWVMKEYGVKESWSLEFTIVDIVYSSYVLKFGDGQLVLLHGDKLVAYARGSKGFVDVEFDGMQYLRDACVHIPNFASPKNILSGGRPRAPNREY